MKQCSKCNEEKPLEEFYKHSGFLDGRNNRCIVCYKASRAPRNKQQAAEYNILRRYGLTVAQYTALYDSQNGCCAICQEHIDVFGRGTHVDHCHTGGHVRGLLCSQCNKGLGMFRDNIENLGSAIKYLENDNAK